MAHTEHIETVKFKSSAFLFFFKSEYETTMTGIPVQLNK